MCSASVELGSKLDPSGAPGRNSSGHHRRQSSCSKTQGKHANVYMHTQRPHTELLLHEEGGDAPHQRMSERYPGNATEDTARQAEDCRLPDHTPGNSPW
jgi:hypothetical protein